MSLVDHVGIPYAGPGFCAVLAARVLAEAGIPWPRVRRPEDADQWQRIAGPARRYDVVVMRATDGYHVGVCLGDGRFLHAEEGSRSGCDDLASPLFAPRVVGIYRYIGERRAPCNT
jgi:NlpC/P60 family.